MSKYAFVTVLLICFFTKGYAQKTLSDYSYIVVPEQFEFLSQKDKYQTNSLAKFLFNKYGFNAFFEDEVPDNLVACDGLKADVIKSGGIIFTKLQIVINDCHGNEIFRSAIGKTKIKEYKKVYHDALRKAFVSISSLHVKQQEIKFKTTIVSTKNNEKEEPLEKVKYVEVVKSKSETKVKTSNNINSAIPIKKYNEYYYNYTTYLLKKTNNGFKLYEDKELKTTSSFIDDLSLFSILKQSSSGTFLYIEDDKSGKAYFNETLDLVIEIENDKKVFKAIN